MQQAREDYFRTSHPDFDCKVPLDLVQSVLSMVLVSMIVSTGLLDSQIYKIQEICTRQKDLRYTNDALKHLLKGLQFLCPVFLSELPRVLGL